MKKNLLQRVYKGERCVGWGFCEKEIAGKCALTALGIINSIEQK